MREVLKTFFVPRTHWAATNVNLVPTVATSAQLARWGGVGVFGAFWMIGTNLMMFGICVVLSRVISSSSSSNRILLSRTTTALLYNANCYFFLTICAVAPLSCASSSRSTTTYRR